MASPAIKSAGLVTLTANVPRELVLKYQTGRPCSNGSVMFTTSTDERLFLAPDQAHKIHALGLAPNEPFRIVRNPDKSISVARVQHEPQPAAVLEPEPEVPESSYAKYAKTSPASALSALMASAYIDAVDALTAVEAYAQAKGVPFRISMGEIRAAAHCIYISASRQFNGGTR